MSFTLDTDFGALAAHSRSLPSSVILFRGHVTRRPSAQAALLFANLEQLTEDLHAGAIVVIGDDASAAFRSIRPRPPTAARRALKTHASTINVTNDGGLETASSLRP